ncbi:MAG: tRNA (adenosine(37)-N6)-dimethylallyltransferase MiaA [Myxococcota bacterium]
MDEFPPMLALVGTTASGKSELAMRVAEHCGGEIVSCDSVQLYRGFNIGSAKPSEKEQKRVPHHLVDLIEWHEPFDAQRYVELADEAVAEIRSRGAVPIVCGGTGLYLRAFRYGLVDLPDPPAGLRDALHQEEAENPGSLYARLCREDPESARTIEPKNIVYIVRAFEIMAATGKTASEVRRAHGFHKPRLAMHLIALRWSPDALRARISARVDRMLDAGLLDETQALLDQGVDPESRPMRAVGYREAVHALQASLEREELHAMIVKSTWSYSRRQRTWLRKEPGVRWIDIEDTDALVEIAQQLSP